MHTAISKCGLFLDLLQDTGLTINMKKTIALFKLTWKGAHAMMKRYTKRTKDGVFLLCPSQRTDTRLIKLVTQITYLGTIMSYRNFARQTMQCRITVATKVSQQLTRWLHKTASLHRPQKIKLWFQCVFPCAIYGLRCIGITQQTLIMLDRFLMQQLRRICREPPHLHHLSHADFLTQYGVPDPLIRLQQQIANSALRETQRSQNLSAFDILHNITPP